MFDLALKFNAAKRLRVKLAEFKVECKKALEKNELEAYNKIIIKGKTFSFEIYEHTQCKKAHEQLINSIPSQEQKVEGASIQSTIMSNSKTIGNYIYTYRNNQ